MHLTKADDNDRMLGLQVETRKRVSVPPLVPDLVVLYILHDCCTNIRREHAFSNPASFLRFRHIFQPLIKLAPLVRPLRTRAKCVVGRGLEGKERALALGMEPSSKRSRWNL